MVEMCKQGYSKQRQKRTNEQKRKKKGSTSTHEVPSNFSALVAPMVYV